MPLNVSRYAIDQSTMQPSAAPAPAPSTRWAQFKLCLAHNRETHTHGLTLSWEQALTQRLSVPLALLLCTNCHKIIDICRRLLSYKTIRMHWESRARHAFLSNEVIKLLLSFIICCAQQKHTDTHTCLHNGSLDIEASLVVRWLSDKMRQ